MEWLQQNIARVFVGSVGLLIAVGILLKLYKPFAAGVRAWFALGEKLEKRRDHTLHVTETDLETYKRLWEERGVTIDGLKRVLRDKTRDCDERDDINAQDRYEIRLLKTRMREERIDYRDIEELVRKWTPPPL